MAARLGSPSRKQRPYRTRVDDCATGFVDARGPAVIGPQFLCCILSVPRGWVTSGTAPSAPPSRSRLGGASPFSLGRPDRRGMLRLWAFASYLGQRSRNSLNTSRARQPPSTKSAC